MLRIYWQLVLFTLIRFVSTSADLWSDWSSCASVLSKPPALEFSLTKDGMETGRRECHYNSPLYKSVHLKTCIGIKLFVLLTCSICVRACVRARYTYMCNFWTTLEQFNGDFTFPKTYLWLIEARLCIFVFYRRHRVRGGICKMKPFYNYCSQYFMKLYIHKDIYIYLYIGIRERLCIFFKYHIRVPGDIN